MPAATVTAHPAPALSTDAQRVCNLAVKLGLIPLIRDRWSDDPVPATSVALLAHATDDPERANWLLDDFDAPPDLVLYGPTREPGVDSTLGDGWWRGRDDAEAALRAALRPDEALAGLAAALTGDNDSPL